MRDVISILTPEQEESSFGHSFDMCQVRLQILFSQGPAFGLSQLKAVWHRLQGLSCFLPFMNVGPQTGRCAGSYPFWPAGARRRAIVGVVLRRLRQDVSAPLRTKMHVAIAAYRGERDLRQRDAWLKAASSPAQKLAALRRSRP